LGLFQIYFIMGQSKNDFMNLQEQGREYNEMLNERKEILPFNRNSLLNASKASLKEIAQGIIADIAEGNKDPLEVLIMAKKGLELFGAIEENAKHYVYGKQYEKQSLYGCEIEPASLGTKFDYSGCNDHELDQLEQMALSANNAVKDRQNFLKAINKSANLVDVSTGEVYTAYPPVKTQTAGYKISIK